ncbi:MAG: arsenate reductase ArsC [Candidatus Cloacimonetes bacterium]|nr:arsenate reductase ArsC [Candidatus Cloacimonadota bacterium]
MAEALLRDLGRGRYNAFSAGSNPTKMVHPLSLEVLEKHGLKQEGFYSKSWEELSHINMDYVITVCDSTANEECPVYLRSIVFAHWGVFDPPKQSAKVGQEILPFEKAFFILKKRVEAFLELDSTDVEFAKKFKKIGKLK